MPMMLVLYSRGLLFYLFPAQCHAIFAEKIQNPTLQFVCMKLFFYQLTVRELSKKLTSLDQKWAQLLYSCS